MESNLLNEVTSGVNWLIDFVLVGGTIVLVGLLVWKSLRRTHFRESGKPFTGGRSEPGGTCNDQQQAQAAGTTTAPPSGGAAAGQGAQAPGQANNTQPQRPQSAPQRVAREKMGFWGAIWRIALLVVLVWFLFFTSYPGQALARWNDYRNTKANTPDWEYQWTTYGVKDEFTEYSVDKVDPKSLGPHGFVSAPPPGAPLLEIGGRRIGRIEFPKESIGDTLYFQCWGRRHDCLGPGSDHRKDPLVNLKNGFFYWVIGNGDSWKANNILKGTVVLHVMSNPKKPTIKLGFRECYDLAHCN